MQDTWEKLSDLLKNNGIAVIPTDTIYGIAGKALDPNVVERIYQVKGRTPDKPFIILISSLQDLELFNIILPEKTRDFLKKIWPAKVSVILPCPEEKFSYLHRDKNSLAFRMPPKPDLIEVIKQTGPLIAPSANPEGQEPAKTISEARNYFADKIDFYLDGGKLDAKASTLITFENDKIKILRQGEYKLQQTVIY